MQINIHSEIAQIPAKEWNSLINDNNPGTIALGSGSVLDRFDYINEFYGVQHKKSVTTNNSGIYFFDLNQKSALIYNGNVFDNLSDSKGLITYMRNKTLSSIPFIEASNKDKEVYWDIGTNVLVYNTFTGSFTE